MEKDVILTFTIPGKPRGKGRARSTRTGHSYTPEETVVYENLIRLAGEKALAGRPPLEGPMDLELEIWLPIPASWPAKRQAAALDQWAPKKPDADNVLKAVLDGLNAVVFGDDVQVCRVLVLKRYSDIPRLVVTVSEALDPDDYDMFR